MLPLQNYCTFKASNYNTHQAKQYTTKLNNTHKTKQYTQIQLNLQIVINIFYNAVFMLTV
jgi:hypothetical protein